MNRRPSAWLSTALLAAALLAGCGGSSKSSSTSTTPAASSTPAAGSTSSAPAATSTTAAPTSTSAAGAAAVTACKQAIQAQTSLPASAKSKLEAVCGRAASGDQAAVRKVAQEVCEEVIKESSVPAGPAREQALAACKQK